MEKEFEKLYRKLDNCIHYSDVTVAIANCPDDWSFCSFIFSGTSKYDRKWRFIQMQLNKEETTSIRDALTKIIGDMP